MEDIFGYVILFSVGLGLFITYQWRRTRVSDLLLSGQNYSGTTIDVFVKKEKTKITLIYIQFSSPTPQEILSCSVDLINKKREILNVKGIDIDPQMKPRKKKNESDKIIFLFDFETFKEYITRLGFKFSTFRMVVETENGKRFKSHELALNKNWTVFKPDSGRYN